jgi:hypothetical protein
MSIRPEKIQNTNSKPAEFRPVKDAADWRLA